MAKILKPVLKYRRIIEQENYIDIYYNKHHIATVNLYWDTFKTINTDGVKIETLRHVIEHYNEAKKESKNKI